jgi:hypothetical protein
MTIELFFSTLEQIQNRACFALTAKSKIELFFKSAHMRTSFFVFLIPVTCIGIVPKI